MPDDTPPTTDPPTDERGDAGGRDWRASAYLQAGNWPAAIPPMGPRREYGPYPWGEPAHDNPYGVDDYPQSHSDAASIGPSHMGYVCPFCGVPVRWDEEVVLITGTEGVLGEIDSVDDPTPAYHPDCWTDRQTAIRTQENESLDGVTDGGMDTSGTEHLENGVGAETEIYCPAADSTFGPAGDDYSDDYCIYCGEPTNNDAHRVDRRLPETFCENTGQSTVQFCPDCGERIDRTVQQTDGGQADE